MERFFQQSVNVQSQFDVFLVDDGSTDGTSEAISSGYPSVRIIKGDGSLFWNRGMLLAWETARSSKDYDGYIWLNDDTIIADGGLSELMDAIRNHNDSIIVGSICSNVDPSVVTYGGYDNKYNRVVPKEGVAECYTINGNIVFVPEVVCDSIAIKLGDYNIGRKDQLLTLPMYMTFLLKDV